MILTSTGWSRGGRRCCASEPGLGGEPPLTLQEVGDRPGLTREPRPPDQAALAQLRERLGY
ncbi:MAG: hypothetical protein U0797_04365 [Gemmataceae bacterium]